MILTILASVLMATTTIMTIIPVDAQEKRYLDFGISFQERDDRLIEPIGTFGEDDTIIFGILVDEDGTEVEWSSLSEEQKSMLRTEHEIFPTNE